ncbi:MAG: hypothetical protein PHX51_05360, partial [Clostridia bacterium]|nr:hypothetical protein [Clostridia bacterium]
FVEWKLTETLEDGTRVYDAVWIHSNILYTITYDYLGVITEQNAYWNNSVKCDADLSNDYYDFVEWRSFDNDEVVVFPYVVTKDIELYAVVEYNTVRTAGIFMQKIETQFNEKFNETPMFFFDKDEYQQALIDMNMHIEALYMTTTLQEAQDILAEATDCINSVKSYENKLTDAYAAFMQNEYFEAQYNDICDIYAIALKELQEYAGGSPYPQFILDNAIEAMDNVYTKEEDIENAKGAKVTAIRALNAYVDALDMDNFTENEWAAIEAALNNGIEAVNNAQGTKEVGIAYANAISVLKDLAE